MSICADHLPVSADDKWVAIIIITSYIYSSLTGELLLSLGSLLKVCCKIIIIIVRYFAVT